MIFQYVRLPTRRPVYSLGGVAVRFRPMVALRVAGPAGLRIIDANLDSGSDDTLLPAYLAARLGIDLVSAPEGEAKAVGGVPVPYRYGQLELRLTDGYDEYAWRAIVGFVAAPMRWAILGHAGALQFFDVQLLGERREAVVEPNSSFPGVHTHHRSPPP